MYAFIFLSEVNIVSSFTKLLPDRTPLRYDECYAKIVLEKVISKSYEKLIIKDKPDLQFPDGSVGIEVTQALDPEQLQAERLYSKIERSLVRNEEAAKKQITKCGAEYKDGVLQGKPGTDSFKLILEALEKKLKTINKGEYDKFNEYVLFLLSDIYSDETMRQEALNFMIEKSSEYKIKFNQIIVLVPESLYIFKLKRQDCQVINVSSENLFKMSCLAWEMVEDSKK